MKYFKKVQQGGDEVEGKIKIPAEAAHCQNQVDIKGCLDICELFLKLF